MQKNCNIKDIKHWGGVCENVQLGPEDQHIADVDVELTSPHPRPQTHQKYINQVKNSHRNLLETGKSLILPKLQGKSPCWWVKWEKKRHQNGTGTLGGICEEGRSILADSHLESPFACSEGCWDTEKGWGAWILLAKRCIHADLLAISMERTAIAAATSLQFQSETCQERMLVITVVRH